MHSRIYNLVKPYLSSRLVSDDISDEGVDEPAESWDELVERVRKDEFSHLQDACYLDHAASPPFPRSLPHALATHLNTTLLSNPHSQSPSSTSTSNAIAASRRLVLGRLFGVTPEDGWDVVFTSGTTAGLKLVGESIDWRDGSFVYPVESHTSLIGIRDLALRSGGRVIPVSNTKQLPSHLKSTTLIALPLQCNATGQRHLQTLRKLCAAPLSTTQQPRPLILVDAASYLSPSQTFPLFEFPYASAPDLVACSLYKILGYPTGLGCLIVKRSSWSRLTSKTYHGGGTLDSYTPTMVWKQPRKNPIEAFEDGTSNYHSIVGLGTAFEVWDGVFGVDMDMRRSWVEGLTRKLFKGMMGLKHGNGKEVVRIYTNSKSFQQWSDTSSSSANENKDEDGSTEPDQGPILLFNLLTPTSNLIPTPEISRLASILNIHLRSGQHCNPGVIIQQVGVSEDQVVRTWEEGGGCVGEEDGGVRLSLGVSTTEGDVDRFLEVLKRFFVVGSSSSECGSANTSSTSRSNSIPFTLSSISLYPIKSCHSQSPLSWTLTPHGLLHDREWALVSTQNGRILSQKKFPKMALIRPVVWRDQGVLRIQVGKVEVVVPLNVDEEQDDEERMWIDRVFSSYLGVPCCLQRQSIGIRYSKLQPSDGGGGVGNVGVGNGISDRGNSIGLSTGMNKIPILYSNESPFLLINSASVDKVTEWIQIETPGEKCAEEVFRGNFVISPLTSGTTSTSELTSTTTTTTSTFSPPSPSFLEDSLTPLHIGPHTFIPLAPCRRCQMICVCPRTGHIKKETFLALARERRNGRGRVEFGIHLIWRNWVDGDGNEDGDAGEREDVISVGMRVSMD